MRQQLEGEGRRDFRHLEVAENNSFQELRLDAGGARRAGNRVVDEELDRIFAVFVIDVQDLCNELFDKGTVFDGLGVQSLGFSLFDFVQILCVQAHSVQHPSVLLVAWMPLSKFPAIRRKTY